MSRRSVSIARKVTQHAKARQVPESQALATVAPYRSAQLAKAHTPTPERISTPRVIGSNTTLGLVTVHIGKKRTLHLRGTTVSAVRAFIASQPTTLSGDRFASALRAAFAEDNR
jgi:hypothetical protein